MPHELQTLAGYVLHIFGGRTGDSDHTIHTAIPMETLDTIHMSRFAFPDKSPLAISARRRMDGQGIEVIGHFPARIRSASLKYTDMDPAGTMNRQILWKKNATQPKSDSATSVTFTLKPRDEAVLDLRTQGQHRTVRQYQLIVRLRQALDSLLHT